MRRSNKTHKKKS